MITVSDLNVTFHNGGRSIHAVQGVSFDVAPGEAFGIVGESGSGKSTVLKAIAERESPEIIILGKQAIDDDNSQATQMLAALLDRPQVTCASKVEIKGQTLVVTREVDAGLETLEVDLPAVISADLRLNEPRYVKLPDIMKAKKKPLDVTTLDALGVSSTGDARAPSPPVSPAQPSAGGASRRSGRRRGEVRRQRPQACRSALATTGPRRCIVPAHRALGTSGSAGGSDTPKGSRWGWGSHR